ncbi:MAG: hypothetical protein GXO23_01650 [Crenarchaeota archaeon]|nr:hypothetical protein [Thermoproteota archaeon]
MRNVLRMLRYLERDERLVIGIDLGHPVRSSTGVCVYSYNRDNYITSTMTPVEALSLCESLRGRVTYVAIDAPLSLPRKGIERELERRCRMIGVKLIPPLLGPMRRLTVCGICIRDVLERLNMTVIETHPTSCLKTTGTSKEDVLKILKRKVINIGGRTRHCIDALICCLAARAYAESLHVEIHAEDDRLILFDRRFIEWLRKERLSG